MKLSAPKAVIFWICVIAFLLGVLAPVIQIPFIAGIAVYLIDGAFILLAIACLFKGL